jgi:hypothetical protein
MVTGWAAAAINMAGRTSPRGTIRGTCRPNRGRWPRAGKRGQAQFRRSVPGRVACPRTKLQLAPQQSTPGTARVRIPASAGGDATAADLTKRNITHDQRGESIMTTSTAIKGKAGCTHASEKGGPSGGGTVHTDMKPVEAGTPAKPAPGKDVPWDQPKQAVAPGRDARQPCCEGGARDA